MFFYLSFKSYFTAGGYLLSLVKAGGKRTFYSGEKWCSPSGWPCWVIFRDAPLLSAETRGSIYMRSRLAMQINPPSSSAVLQWRQRKTCVFHQSKICIFLRCRKPFAVKHFPGGSIAVTCCPRQHHSDARTVDYGEENICITSSSTFHLFLNTNSWVVSHLVCGRVLCGGSEVTTISRQILPDTRTIQRYIFVI